MSRRAQTLAALALAALWGAALGYQHWRGNPWFLDRVEATMTDLRTLLRGVRPAPDIVTIVAIDDAAASRAGGYPLPRAALADIIAALAGLGPKAIAIDLLLVDPGPEPGDTDLVAALAAGRSIIAAAAVYADGSQWVEGSGNASLDRVPHAERLLLPLGRFGAVAAIGVVNVATDFSGTPRAVPMVFRAGDRLQASLPLRTAAVATGEDPDVQPGSVTVAGRTIPTDIGNLLPLNFYGARGTVRTLSAAEVLAGRLDPVLARDRIVVIGATVTGGGDVFPTPFDPVLPGVEVMATAIANLMTGDALVRNETTRLVDAAFAIMLPVAIVGLLAWRRSVFGLALIALVVAAWLAVNLAAFSRGIWLSAALPMTAAIPPAILFGLWQIWFDRRRAQHFAGQARLLRQFQAPMLARHLDEHPDFLKEPIRQDAAIVFIDLSGFTGLSETLGPISVRDLLNDFYGLVESEARGCGGTITTFMGDGAMIVFGLPEASAGDAAAAAKCCVGLAGRMRGWLATLPPAISSRVGFKLGAHFGVIVASRLGGSTHQQITATGDTVNVASRLMEIAAAAGADVAVSHEMLQVAGSDNALYRSGSLAGPRQTDIRGRSGTLAVWLWRPDRPAL